MAVVSLLMGALGDYCFQYSDWTVNVVYLLIWTCSLVLFCYALSTLFDCSRVRRIYPHFLHLIGPSWEYTRTSCI